MGLCIGRTGDHVGREARPRVCANGVEFDRRESRVRNERPRIEARSGEEQHDLRDAVFSDDHHAVAASHAALAQECGRGVHGFGKLRAR
jgi:hypothetical protein